MVANIDLSSVPAPWWAVIFGGVVVIGGGVLLSFMLQVVKLGKVLKGDAQKVVVEQVPMSQLQCAQIHQQIEARFSAIEGSVTDLERNMNQTVKEFLASHNALSLQLQGQLNGLNAQLAALQGSVPPMRERINDLDHKFDAFMEAFLPRRQNQTLPNSVAQATPGA